MSEATKDEGGMDLMSLLAANVNDLADIPGFDVPAKGHYRMKLYFEAKEVNNKPAIEGNYEIVEVLEMTDPMAQPPLVGTKFSQLFQINNEFGLGNLKKVSKPIFEGLGLITYGELLAQVGKASGGVEITAVVSPRKDKNDPDKVYANVLNIELAS